jgi:hypothetical protein
MINLIERVDRIFQTAEQKADREAINREIAAETASEIVSYMAEDVNWTIHGIAAIVYRHIQGGF